MAAGITIPPRSSTHQYFSAEPINFHDTADEHHMTRGHQPFIEFTTINRPPEVVAIVRIHSLLNVPDTSWNITGIFNFMYNKMVDGRIASFILMATGARRTWGSAVVKALRY